MGSQLFINIFCTKHYIVRIDRLFFKVAIPLVDKMDINKAKTSEIQGEVSHENMISSHVKMTCYLHTFEITVAMVIS